MLLGDPAEMRVTAIVDERDVPRIAVGQSALLSSDAWPGRGIRGHVRELTPAGDPDQRAFRVRLGLDESEPLPIGMTLEINIVVRSEEHTSELQSLMRISYAVFCLKKKKKYKHKK